MAVIGSFTLANDGGWVGHIQTLTMRAKLRFVPNDRRESDTAPVFRIFLGHSRVGEAWEARSNGENPKTYLRVRLDDPSWYEPVSAALFPAEDGGAAQLVWTRRNS